MSLRICLLTDQDLDADPFPEDDWPCDPRPFLPEAEWSVLTLDKESCVADVMRAVGEGYDLFFNLCDGAWDEGRVGIEVIHTLESLNVPFTGANSSFFEPSREAMKRVCRAWEIDTPRYVIARDDRDIERAADMLSFPLIVKHPNGYASCGMTPASRVANAAELSEQVDEMVTSYASALIEEFIVGTECTVLVAENAEDSSDPIVYKPIQYGFPEGESFKHHDLKWVHFEGLSSRPVEDCALDMALREASSSFFRGMRGTGYGRCDARVDSDGRVFMLEINPNCGIYYPPTDPGSADLVLLDDPEGHEGFTRRVVAAAFARHRQRQKAWRVSPRANGDYGSFATRDISPGETIVVWEEQPHRLVTRSHAERCWDERDRAWFDRYAWPLTDEIWVTWSEDPEEWRPINHGCDPNAWLQGLDVVARRFIAEGEEILLDYATFSDERMPSFECGCGSPECRGIVRGDDHLLDLVARYGGHISEHIARRRAQRTESDL
jgi:D-alanine-D-alanine ligase-like ATP-grasp enzyme